MKLVFLGVEYTVWLMALLGVALLIAMPKKVYALILVGVCNAMGAYFYYFAGYGVRDRNPMAVTVSIRHDATTCREDAPLLVVVSNGSAAAVSKVRWQVAAHLPGDTTNLVSYGRIDEEWDVPYSSDRPIGKGESASYCHKVPTLKTSMLPNDLEYEAVFKSVQFAR